MKIFMTLVMALVTTSVFAETCVLNGECKKEDCKALNDNYYIAGNKDSGKCLNALASQAQSVCPGINESRLPEEVPAANDTTKPAPATGLGR